MANEMNREGMTFREWCYAARVSVLSERGAKAWKRGEDPTEWRAAIERFNARASNINRYTVER